jgi:hypothetical protein
MDARFLCAVLLLCFQRDLSRQREQLESAKD